MARAIAEANDGDSVLVGVVGMMHLDGIERALVGAYGYTLVKPLSKCGTTGTGSGGAAEVTIPNANLANSARLFDEPFIS